jgi:transmembrane sensor
LLRPHVHRWKRISRAGITLIAACVVFVAIGIGISLCSKAARWVEYAATNASSRSIVLDDGTGIVVEAGSRALVRSLPWARTVRLESGRAKFDVAKTWSSFRVLVGDTVLEDIGTSFYVVRRADGSSFVGVIEGAVDVRPAAGKPAIARVQSGNWAEIHPNRPLRMSGSADPGRGGGPPQKRLKHYIHAPLGDIVNEVNRYSGSYQFMVEDDVARTLLISGNFNVADPKLFIWALQQQGGLHVATDGYLVVIRSSDRAKKSVVP